ncbi:MAG: DNA replication/repair protein RecF [Thermodesulfobacteriota bacterium]
MILKSLTLRNFRSYAAESFSFHDKINVVYGDNAQGKTNLLEAVHLLLMFRPFKQVKFGELISFGASECRIKGEVESDSGLDEVHVLLSGEKKTIKLNGKIVYKTSRILGRYNVVSFLPSDIDLVKGSPQGRRRYLDALICALEPAHLRDLKLYHRSLLQRNALLAMTSGLTPQKLEVWDEKLTEAGAQVVSRRIRYIEKITPNLNRIYGLTSGGGADVDIQYRCSFGISGNHAEDFKRELSSRFEKDRRRGHTSVGPHRDLVGFTISGRDASVFASQGEAKNLALSLKASEIELVRTTHGKMPILLLDDVTSELDERRKGFLFGLLDAFPGQIFITSTSLGEIHLKGEIKAFHIRAGNAKQRQIKS